MVHNLFDEYRFFSKYPDKELRITGILFGALIQEQLVSSITLGIALRYVLEALRKAPSPAGTTTSSGKMFNFGMFALEQFKGRLHEWPQYCSHIVQIPHLKETRAELVAEIEIEMTKSQNRAAAAAAQKGTLPPTATAATRGAAPSATSSTSQALQQQQTAAVPDAAPVVPAGPPRVAEFGPNLGRAVTEKAQEDQELEAPPDTILDRVQFMINNMAPSNVEQKAQELRDMLDPTYFPWLGHFLVVKRISTQANFHSLYLSFLDHLGDYGKGLVEAILQSAYHNIGKLLRSPKITTSSSERSFLKNLGIWLGQITLARNRPILQIMLDCKELLLQGYETGKLIAVAPFLAKTLEGAKNSVVFRPPNPWLMGILGVFRSVYNVDGLKMNIKFEVEVLCKNLGIKLEDIPLRNDVLSRRIAPTKERNPVRAAMASPEAGPPVPSSSGAVSPGVDKQDQETVIPNLAAYVSVNPSLPQLLQQAGGGGALSSLTTAALKRFVPLAVDKAIREIIQPVVERSVTIACITTKEIVTKDFAMESDELKMRKAGQLMVANLAGSLALVTCREPLRSSVSQHLRRLLTENIASGKLVEQEQNVIEQCVQICATDNLELGCMLIEKAATEKAVKDVDEALSAAMNARRTQREQTGQPFYDMSIFSNGNQRYPAALPEQLQPKPGGLRVEHFQLYESFQRMSRPSQGLGSMTGASTASVAAGSAAMGMSPARSPVSGLGGPNELEQGLLAKQSAIPFSTETLSQLTSKLDAAVTGLLSVAGSRAPEVKLAMLPPDHQIRQLLAVVKQLMPNAGPSGTITRPLTSSEQELVLGFSQNIFKRLYELSLGEPLRLEALVALLENINAYCPKLGKDMGTWATYAPAMTEQQRRLHRTVLLLLVRSRLLAVPDLDSFLAARADNGRNHTWVEFSLLFIRTAFLERISAPTDFPKLMDLMTRIVEGRSQATPQIMQVYRKNIVRMLEENGKRVSSIDPTAVLLSSAATPPEQARPKLLTLEENSSLSPASLAVLSQATAKVAEATEAFTRKDPANARQQVTALLDGWIRLQSDSGGMSDKALAQYMQVLQQVGVGKVEEHTERFLRLSALVVVDAVLKSAAPNSDGPRVLNHTFIDLYARLLVILFRHMHSGGSAEQVNAQRLGVLNKILGSIVRSMMWHYEKKKAEGASWDQRPWFRLFLNLVIDLNKPDPSFEPIRLAILSVFGVAFHMCQPLVMPGFAFAWLELVSHRHFLPNLMLSTGQKGWNIAHQLLIDHLLFLQPYLAGLELTAPIKKLYEGTLRVLLVLLHDFPSFLAGYHLSFCNVIPDNCVQLRNIILSATPKGMNPPDPFTPNLKIDLLSDIGRSPVVLSNVLGPIESIRGHLDAYLKDAQRRSNFLAGLLPLLYKDHAGTTMNNELDVPKVNSLIVYVGAHALARLQNSQISLSRTPEMEVIQKLMELDDRGRYICLNAIANQLRFPSSHTHYFSCVMLYLFSESKSVAVKEQVTRVLLERLIVNRPHPWGLLITFIELIKNQRYGFWNYPFTRCATEIEKVFESVARSTLTLVGGATVEIKD
jgi:CCR4-NOT transcription complex subunit 1